VRVSITVLLPGEPDVVLMIKVGDDLRQDALIMQLLRVMNDLWRKEGLDMQMMLYDCISTGFERGLLQIVQNANSLGKFSLLYNNI
jgi:phosphatidylinositol kinase/protein kinase (PI-3  family)